jgi:hypothetical protein
MRVSTLEPTLPITLFYNRGKSRGKLPRRLELAKIFAKLSSLPNGGGSGVFGSWSIHSVVVTASKAKENQDARGEFWYSLDRTPCWYS